MIRQSRTLYLQSPCLDCRKGFPNALGSMLPWNRFSRNSKISRAADGPMSRRFFSAPDEISKTQGILDLLRGTDARFTRFHLFPFQIACTSILRIFYSLDPG